MSLIPMNLRQPYPTTRQPNLRNSFHLAPSGPTILPAQTSAVMNPCTRSNRFNIGYFANELKIHCEDLTGFSREPHNAGLQLRRAISFHPRETGPLERHAIAPPAARLCSASPLMIRCLKYEVQLLLIAAIQKHVR